jgi:nucleotide-binding universal stress UspA family protein
MKRFKTIIVKISQTEDPMKDLALVRGMELSKRNNAKLILMDVIVPSGGILKSYDGIISPKELTGLLVSQRSDEFESIVNKLKENGIDASQYVTQGKDYIEVIKAMLRFKGDLLIKAANPTNASYDSNDFHLMRKSPQPVWLIKPERETSDSHVLASIDLSMEQEEEGRGLNRRILEIAKSLCNIEGAKLTVISCWALYGEEAMRHGAFTRTPEEQIQNLLNKEEKEYQDCFSRLLEDTSDFEINKVLMKGDPKKLIPEYVNENDVDIVVMGTVGRSGIPGMLIGNTSETVLQSISSSVITLKPINFESPIK